MSFFAKDPVRARDWHLLRGSSVIRGQQISEYLGAKYNPADGYENDVCIFVKPPPYMYDNIGAGKRDYVDILDGTNEAVSWLKEHPNVNVIAASQSAYEYLLGELQRDNVILIPQHHCNYERIKRRRGERFVAGYINTPRELKRFLPDITAACDNAGVDLKVLSIYKNRLDVRNFYEQIDLQIIWRHQKFEARQLKNALKLANAGSFGIPTVALQEVGYKEYEGYYVPVSSFKELAKAIKEFKESKDLYEQYASKNIEKAESYHIDNVAKQYLKLLEV